MSYELNASHIFNQDDNYMVMLGFADDEFEPSKFVIIQKAHEYDDQDVKLGMDKLYIKVEDQSRAKYGGVSSFTLDDNCLVIELEQDTQSSLKVDGNIRVTLEANHPELESTLSVLKKIASDENIPFNRPCKLFCVTASSNIVI
ncbi:Imm10 family immunity protein [Pleionea litopenaei]|uniref:Imm10 family immunity protein n=1 Tax=Pleionea litopenaei TaxID=3070815 RepID=A0AA51RU57_9GAMM|nr:Imm10 family immunity protein [Pleionea sp. HL-JVS1]WMS87524.1 Imm10 family immunity protein [Pleionea sp. HL-JVS1]